MMRMPCALAIGGLDPGGGAGVLADVRAFARAGAFGCAALTLVTLQSTAGLRGVKVVEPDLVLAQAREVLRAQRVRAVKVGALGTAAHVHVVTRLLEAHPRLPCVVDTPFAPTRGGTRLLTETGVELLRARLLPRASLVTANAPEAAVLLGSRVESLEEARVAARALVRMGARAALVKGGHLEGPLAVDVLATGSKIVELRAPRIPGVRFHGAGCTLASLIAGRIATGARLVDAVRWAKRVHHAELARARDVGGPLRVVML